MIELVAEAGGALVVVVLDAAFGDDNEEAAPDVETGRG